MLSKSPLLSVIVPIYNTEKYLDQCIRSIREQTYKNLEIILIDDGSSDRSLDICLKHQKSDNRISVFSQTNKGLIESRKLGVSCANGNIIGFVDSDDWIEADMYMQLVKIYTETNTDLVCSGIIYDYEYSHKNKSTYIFDNYSEGFHEELAKNIYPTMLYDPEIGTFGLKCNLVTKILKRELLLRVYEDINSSITLGEDCLALFTYCLLARNIYIEKSAYYHYNIRSGSMCLKKDEGLLHNSYLLFSELKKKFYNYNDPYTLMQQLRKYILKLEAHNLNLLYDINVNSLGVWNFGFGDDIRNSKIIIYGAGACGQAFYQFLCSEKMESQIVAWIDKDPSNKSDICLYQIDSPDILYQAEYDYIIISVLKEDISIAIQNDLIEKYLIERKKILWKQPKHIPIWG